MLNREYLTLMKHGALPAQVVDIYSSRIDHDVVPVPGAVQINLFQACKIS